MKRFKPTLFIPLFLLFLWGCQKEKPVEITFAFGPDDSGILASSIDKFNEANKGKIKVNWEVGSRSSTEFYNYLLDELNSEESTIDVLGSDVVWTAAFAENELVENLSTKFFDYYEPRDFILTAMNSAVYHHNVWGIPWFTDAGLLYYRKDFLEDAGYSNPPETWDELIAMSSKIMKDKDIKYGYVFQGAQYEGGVTNACEFIWNAGGRVLIGDLDVVGSFDETETDLNIITLNSAESIQGIETARRLIEAGISPKDVFTYLELEATQSFQNGDAVFMRSWPGIFGIFKEEESRVKPEQVGIASIPVSKKGMPSYSCLGGWNLMVNSKSTDVEKDAAWEFIQFLVDPGQQKERAMQGSNLPSLRNLYDDAEIIQKNPMIMQAKDIIASARPRPVSPYYDEFSPLIAKTFNKVLRGEASSKEAIKEKE